MLLLTTTGRKSGEPRTTPLLYMADGEDFVVVGSNGGREEAPLWVRNLQATPKAVVQAGRRRHRVVAHFATGAEGVELWPKLSAYYHGWDYYKTLTDRELPVVVFRREVPATSD
jgi:deazaflavin-dependent oxidoreductase (nitroreductase family)